MLEKELAIYNEAMIHYKQCVKIQEEELGLDHPVAAGTLYNIALVHRKQGRHDLEAECSDKFVVIYAKVYGNEHSETADARKQAARACA